MDDRFIYRRRQHLLPDYKLRQIAPPQRAVHRFPSIFWDFRFPGHAHIHSCNPVPRLPEEQEVHPAIAGERP